MPIWMIIVTWLARLILVILIGLSIWSIAIILEKIKLFKILKNISWDDHDLFQKTKNLNQEKREIFFAAEIPQLKRKWESGLSILGTLGSSTPFIGLLGTILGIIVAFGELSQGKADTNAIMFALAEALILTAVGLFVAIPAVIAFNYFSKELRSILLDIDYKREHLKLRNKE